MDCYIELSNDVKKSSQYKNIKQISDWKNNILTSGINFGFKLYHLIVKDFLGQDYVSQVDTKHRSHFTKSIEFFVSKKTQKTRTFNIYSLFEQLKLGIKFETNSGSFGYYTIKLANNFKILNKNIYGRNRFKTKNNTTSLFW